jgi:anaerobic selenocysteine-containing dehydrogenase
MSRKDGPASGRVSRRDFLFVAAVGAGAAAAPAFWSSAADAAKMSPKAMAYRPNPNGSQRCENCANFQPPTACKVVDGTISPTGWCILYRSK